MNTTVIKRKLVSQFAMRLTHTKPPVMEQTEHIDTHVGGFVEYMEPSPARRQFGEYFKACLAKEGVEFQELESKNYQMCVDEMEFDPPSPPRPDSEAWAYMYGNNLVEFKTMAETLSPDKEYKRGFFEFRIDPLIKKMKIHYNHLDWRSKYESMKKEWEHGVFSTFQRLKAEVLAKEVAADKDGYIELYRSNSHFNYKADDPYHYYMPVENEIKWTNLNKFDWDKTSQIADPAPYVEKLQVLAAALDAPLKKTRFVAATQGVINSLDLAAATELVSAIANACPSIVEPKLEREEEIMTILEKHGIKETVTLEHANNASALLRGSHVSGADLVGKTVAEVVEIIKDTAKPEAITTRYHAIKIGAAIAADPAGILVGTLFGWHTDLFAQFFINEGDFDMFVTSNDTAFASMVDSFVELNATADVFGKHLDAACTAADKAAEVHGVANSGCAAHLRASGLHLAVEKATTPGEGSFLAQKLNAMGQDLKSRGSFLGNVNCRAAALYIDSDEVQNSVAAKVLLNSLFADYHGFNGTLLQGAATAATARNFGDIVAANLAEHLVISGKVASVSRDFIGAVETKFGDLVESATKVNEARAVACEKVMTLNLDIALKDLASLEIQYKY